MGYLDKSGLQRLWAHIVNKINTTVAESTPEVDNTLAVEGAAADAKAVGDALAGKQPSGDYVLSSELGNLATKDTVSKSDLASSVQTSLGKADTALQSYTETDPTVPSWAKAASKPSYTASEVGAVPTSRTINGKALSSNITLSASDVSADASGTASSAVSTHNTSTSAHNDIRNLITGLTTRLNTLADSDDTTLDQMSEIVAYIKSNKSLIESVTTNKVNVADIINNLTTNVTNKPLSAAQGVALKALIDAIEVPSKLSDLTADSTHRTVTDTEKATWNAKSDFSGSYNDLTNKPTIPTVPTKVSAFTNDVGYITGYTETDPTVPSWAKATNKPSYTKSEVGLGNVDNVKQYSASNPPPYPVTSVNGQTGVVTLNASDVGAPTIEDVRSITDEEIDTIFSSAELTLPLAEEVGF